MCTAGRLGMGNPISPTLLQPKCGMVVCWLQGSSRHILYSDKEQSSMAVQGWLSGRASFYMIRVASMWLQALDVFPGIWALQLFKHSRGCKLLSGISFLLHKALIFRIIANV